MTKSISNNAGFTLIEVLVAMVITLVGLLGLLQVATLATEQNLKTQMRDEAVQIAEEEIRGLQLKPFALISTTYSAKTAKSRLRGISTDVYTVTRGSSDVAIPGASLDGKTLKVTVEWTVKGKTFSHSASSLVTK